MYHEDVRNLCGMGGEGEGEGEGKAGEGVLYKTKWVVVVVGMCEGHQQGRSEKRCRDFCLATEDEVNIPAGWQIEK
jgi:hypothetical protein